MSDRADTERYERRHPSTGVPAAQAADRQQRHDLLRGIRTRKVSVVVPALPWQRRETS